MQPPAGGRRSRGRTRTRWVTWPRVGLAVLLLVTLGLRLWGIEQGLPYSYNSDEARHFVPKAVQFLAGDWNPHDFLNPPGYSSLLAVVLELWFSSGSGAAHALARHPTEVFLVARGVCALLGTLSVWLLYGAGVRLFQRTGPALLAAAIYGTAFLPIFYSHLALNDVPTLWWVCLALFGVAGVWRRGLGRDYLVAGAAVGLAGATKDTGGWVLVLLLIAAARAAATGLAGPVADGKRPWARAAVLTAAALVTFSLGNPYWFLDFRGFIDGVGAQASATSGASGPAKLGTAPGGGIRYYLWTFSWGLGLGPAVASLGGVGLLLWRRRGWLLALLVPGPVAFIVFMGLQERYFGRWLMPVFPTVALLAGWCGAEVAGWLVGLARPLPPAVAGGLVALALLTQSVVSVIHSDRVLSRPYTTNSARAWMIRHIPEGENVYIEPVIPGNWTAAGGTPDPYEPDGARWFRYPTWFSHLAPDGRPLVRGARRFVTLDQYERTLYPGLIQRLERHAFCWVLSGTLQSGRAFLRPVDAPRAVAFDRELARVGTLVYRSSPYGAGADPVPFNFDWSTDDYPPQYRRPGPVITIYRLHQGACAG